MKDVTQILQAAEAGDPHAAELLLPLVYDEELLAVDEALTTLAAEDAPAAEIVTPIRRASFIAT